MPLSYDGEPTHVLTGLLQHADPILRLDAACALGDRLRVHEILAFDAETTKALLGLLHDPVHDVRVEAAIALAEAHDARVLETLVWALQKTRYRLDAIRALGVLGSIQAIPTLEKFLKRWLLPWADRLQAAAALCALGNAEGQSYLAARIFSRKEGERAAAIHFLGEAHHPQGLELLLSIVADPKHEFRDVAVRALGFLADPRAVEILRQAYTETSDTELQGDIVQALKELGVVVP